MEKNVMNGKALWSAKKEKRGRECKPIARSQAAQGTLMTAGVIVVAVLFIGAMVAPLQAQSYPTKPIRLILPFPPAGPTDFLGRIIGTQLTERLGQPVVLENRPGAGGNVGLEFTAKARPDGYTIVIGSVVLATGPSLYKKLNYDPMKDLATISQVSKSPNLILVHPSLPVKNLKELVEYARANPGKLNYASSGIGTTLHLAVELIKSLHKIDIVHVPYKGGGGPALTALMGGEVQMMVLGPLAAMPQMEAGKVRALAVLGAERLPYLPNVPTAKEAGLDHLVVPSWHGLLAPGGTPRDIINRLNAEWVKIAAIPDTREKMEKVGFEPVSGTPEQFLELIKGETLRWARVIKDANIPLID